LMTAQHVRQHDNQAYYLYLRQSTAGQLRTSGSLSKRISDDGNRRLAL